MKKWPLIFDEQWFYWFAKLKQFLSNWILSLIFFKCFHWIICVATKTSFSFTHSPSRFVSQPPKPSLHLLAITFSLSVSPLDFSLWESSNSSPHSISLCQNHYPCPSRPQNQISPKVRRRCCDWVQWQQRCDGGASARCSSKVRSDGSVRRQGNCRQRQPHSLLFFSFFNFNFFLPLFWVVHWL